MTASLRLLFVEDDDEHRELLKMKFASTGFRCVFVSSALEGTLAYFGALILDDPFDAAILDCGMPEKDGFAVAKQICTWEDDGQEGRKTHLATLSAFDDIIDRTTLPNVSRIEKRFRKPDDLIRLPELVDEWLGLNYDGEKK